MKKIKYFFTHILRTHFNNKLLFSYIVLIAVPLFLFLLFCYNQSSIVAREQTQYTAEKVLSQTKSYLEDQIASYKNIINVISYDKSLQNVLITGEKYSRESVNTWLIPGENTGNIMYTMNSSKDISDIHLYSLEGKNSFENSEAFQALTETEQKKWYEKSSSIDDSPYLWIPPTFFSSEDLGHIMFFKKIPDVSKLFNHIGIIRATLSDNVFHNILAQAATTPNTSIVLFNQEYQIIDSYQFHDFFTDEQLKELPALYHSNSSNSIQAVNYNGHSYLMGFSPLTESDWNLMFMIPEADTLASYKFYLNQMVTAVFLILLSAIPILYVTSRFLTTRIKKLNTHIDTAIKNNFKSIPMYNGNDEIGQLSINFNAMLNKINELLIEQYHSGYALKDLELQILQAQINPHFLYNTLDMIYWLSYENKDPRVSKIARELGNFYKLSLGHGQNIVTIESELAHVKAYTEIQNIRFDNKIQLIIDIPDELLKHTVIKILLQPLVENSILHGIREKESESGTIIIHGQKTKDNIILTLQDDGVGMSENEIQILLSPPSSNSGYAIWNIEERIKLVYGPDYGLHFYSQPKCGTTVKIYLPITPCQ